MRFLTRLARSGPTTTTASRRWSAWIWMGCFRLIRHAAGVSLTVYDVLGRWVRQVWQGPLGAGSHRLVWDGHDEVGKVVAAEVYIYQVEVGVQVEAKKTTKLP